MKIGLIAGNGQFPIIFAKAAKKKGYAVYAVAYHNETHPNLGDYVNAIEWMHLGQIKRLIRFFRKNDVEYVFEEIRKTLFGLTYIVHPVEKFKIKLKDGISVVPLEETVKFCKKNESGNDPYAVSLHREQRVPSHRS